MRKITIVVIALCAIYPQLVYSQQTGEVSKVGTTCANFLKLEVGARAASLAGAFTAVANDASAMQWNPAGMSYISRATFSYHNINLYAGIKHQFISAVFPFGAGNAIGLGVNMVDMGKILKTTLEDPDGTVGLYFESSNMAVSLSFSRTLTDRVTVGVSARWVHEQIWQEKANGYCADVGVLYSPGITGLRVGMSITNFGPDMKMNEGPLQTFQKTPDPDRAGTGQRDMWARWEVESYDMPVSYQMGAILDVVGTNAFLFNNRDNRCSFFLELNDSFDNSMRTKYAVEYEWKNTFALRGGYKMNYDTATFSFGAGLHLPLSSFDVRFDYAYADYGDLGHVNFTSLTLGF